MIGELEPQVELGGMGVDVLQGSRAQAGQLHRGQGRVLQDEHHLEQGRVAQRALRLQLFHQAFERQILVLVSVQGGLLHLAQQGPEAVVSIQASPQDQGVDEEADQRGDLGPAAPGDGDPHRQVGLPAVTVEQQVEGRQQGHEQGRAFPLAEGFERLGQFGGELEGEAVAVVSLDRGPGAVGGQFQDGREGQQLLFPVIQVGLEHLPGQPAALPAGVIGVLHRQGGQGGRIPGQVRPVEGAQLVDQHPHRPAV